MSEENTYLTSDYYQIQDFINNIKKSYMSSVDEDTLMLGIYGYLGETLSTILQNSIVMASEFSSEAIPTKAKYKKNVIANALSLGITDLYVTPAKMDVLLCINETDLNDHINSSGYFIFDSDNKIMFNDIEFHADYDIKITRIEDAENQTSGTSKYTYTAQYIMDTANPVSDLTNPYLASPFLINTTSGKTLMINLTIRQVSRSTIVKKIISNNTIEGKLLTFQFDNQIAAFTIDAKSGTKSYHLTPVYDGLLSDETNYFYYTFLDDNTIRCKFDNSTKTYYPTSGDEITINIQTSLGSSGNFKWTEDVNPTFIFSSTKYNYTGFPCEFKPVNGESIYGIDAKSIDELKKIIPREALARDSITSLTDLENYFNALDTEYSKVYMYKKIDNCLKRLYYNYLILKNSDNVVVPTNTLDIEVKDSDLTTAEEGNTKRILKKNKLVEYIPGNDYGHIISFDVTDSTFASKVGYKSGTYTFNNNTTIVVDETSLPSTTGITAITIFSPSRFKMKTNYTMTQPSTYHFLYHDTEWYLTERNSGNTAIQLSNYGIKVEGNLLTTENFNIVVTPNWKLGNTTTVLLSEYGIDYNGEANVFGIEYNYAFTTPLTTSMDKTKFTIDSKTFASAVNYISNTSYSFRYYSSQWELLITNSNNQWLPITLSDYGITFTGTASEGNTFYITLTYNSKQANLNYDYKSNHIEINVGVNNSDDMKTIPTIKESTFMQKVQSASGIYIFLYTSISGSNTWSLNGSAVTLSEYGITIASGITPVVDDKIIVSLSTNIDLDDMILSVNKAAFKSAVSSKAGTYTFTYDASTSNPTWKNGTTSIDLDDYGIILYTSKYAVIHGDKITIDFNYNTLSKIANSSAFYYKIPYDILVNTDPLYTQYRIACSSYYKQLEFTHINENCKYQFISNGLTAYRSFLENTGNYCFQVTLEQNINNDTSLVEFYDENTLEVKSSKVSLYLVFCDENKSPVRYTKAYLKEFDQDTCTYTFEFNLYTEDKTNADDKIKINSTNLFKVNTTTEEEIYFSNNVYAKLFVVSEQTTESETIDDYTKELYEIVPGTYGLKVSNVYTVYNGIDFFFDFSNIIHSAINNYFGTGSAMYYIVKSVPLVKSNYLLNEASAYSFINELITRKNYMDYAAKKIEDNFSLDFKFFNTYGPSKVYSTDPNGENLIDKVNLNLVFDLKLLSTSNGDVVSNIISDIKEYIENINDITDIHMPNLIWKIKETYSSDIVYFEFKSMNGLTNQHLYNQQSVNNSTETLKVPEFINISNVESLDENGNMVYTPEITINLV